MHISLTPTTLAVAFVLVLFHLAPSSTLLPSCTAAPTARTNADLARLVILAHSKKSHRHHHGGTGPHHSHGGQHHHSPSPSSSSASSPDRDFHKRDLSNEQHRETAQVERKPADRAAATFRTAGGLVDEDWFDIGITRLEVAVHDPVVSIAQSSPGIQCAFTGEQGGVFVVDDRATVQVKPPQSFIRADCRVARLQV
ncbi:hypothetical protein MN608_11077 [Microdochium nivale]|nr:hypothetical protein MN608_11077 [Microdochium nivale]